MSRHGEIRLPFGADEHVFRLTPTKGWAKVQEKCDAGPPEIIARLAGGLNGLSLVRSGKLSLTDAISMGALGRWRVDDVREVIFQGLLGGGMNPTEAGTLVRELVDEHPLLDHVETAFKIAMASVCGVPDEPPGEADGAAKGARRRSREAS